MKKYISIVNKKAKFEYEFIDKFVAGIILKGTEIKSLRNHKASISESFAEVKDNEVFVVNMTIEPYSHGGLYNHQPKRTRKLLLTKREIKKIYKKVQNVGLTLIPLKLFINEKGYAKVEIAVAKGKKLHDKRNTIQDRETKIKLDRVKKEYNKF